LNINGDLESHFLGKLTDLRRHSPDTRFAGALGAVLADTSAGILVLVRNPALVLDAGLASRIAKAIDALPDPEHWSIAGAGGLGLDERRHLGLYATATPAIPDSTGPHPLLDVLPDLVLLNTAFCREVLENAPSLPDAALEPIVAVEGYLAGRISVFLPGLGAGIDGDLLARDIHRLSAELGRHFSGRLAGQTIATLSGDNEIATERTEPCPAQHNLADSTRRTIATHCRALSLSIVIRTRFDRPHLLRRLLTSLSRARRSETEIETILSSDAKRTICADQTKELQRDFCNLTLRLQHNPPSPHSRIANMLGGIRSARNEYVMLIDDDDYVDLFAFDAIAPALFANNRPLIVTGSEIHDEIWEATPSGRWVLSQTTPRGHHAADGWRNMFTGVNRLPVCAMVMPRERLLARLDQFSFDHDLSEDYALFLLVLTDPALPAIAEMPDTFCHISVRGTENSVTMPDRRPWARDIGGYLADLTANRAVAGAGSWQILSGAAGAGTALTASSIAELRTALDHAETNLRLLGQENAHLREMITSNEAIDA